MIAHTSIILSVALAAFSVRTEAAAANDVSLALGSSLEARAGLCCALAQDNRIIQTVCQHMYENCGGWDNCVSGNDNQWCRHCIVNHPEDEACLKLTWPPADPAPVGKRARNEGNIIPPEQPSQVNKERSLALDRRAPQSAIITTAHTPNVAQSFAKTFGLVTIRIIVSAVNVVTYNIENAGAEEIVWTIVDQATQWIRTGTLASGVTDGGAAPNQVVAKGGDSFKVIVG